MSGAAKESICVTGKPNMGGGRPRRHHHQRMDDEVYNGMKLGEYWSTDIQVAINDGNRREDAFFMVRVGKSGTSLPFQQPIPLDFARDHPELHKENTTLESPCGRSWTVVVRRHSCVVRFGKGWRQFSLENRLREGYQLLFTLVRKLHFMVTFYDHRGKCHTSFPPLAPQHVVVESLNSQRPTVYDEEHASEPPTSSAFPVQPTKPVTRPAEPVTRPAEPATRPAALNSDQAKFILRHFLPQLPPDPLPDPKTTIPNEDARNGFPTLDESTEKEQAIGEGEAYINLDSDDDDDLIYLEASEFQPAKKLVYVPKAELTTTIRDILEAKPDHNHEFEQTGFHSPSEKQVSDTPEIEEDDHFTSDDDIPLKRQGPRASESFQIRQKQPVRPVRKKVSVRRTSCWKRERSPSPSPPFVVAATTRSGSHGVGDTSGRGNYAGEEGSMETLSSDRMSRALRLLQQQGCMKFSEIVSKCQRRRHVSEKDRSRAAKAAMRFASALQNAMFLAVMCDAQVYHGFHLPIPQEILEVTGTVQANKVKVCLTDREEAFYVAEWAWHSFSETPLLNSDGWAKFALDHTLEEGDVCVFELIDSGPTFGPSRFLFCVHIFRVVETHRGGHTPLHNTLGKKSAAAEWELRHRKWPITDLGLPSQPRKFRTSNNLRPHVDQVARSLGGSRGQRQF